MANSDASRPLLSATKSPGPPLPRVSKLASTALLALGTIRAAAGVGCLVAPQLTARAFFVDLPAGAGLIGQVAGGREIAIGALTLDARRRVLAGGAADGGLAARDALKRVLLANIVVDSLDVVCCLVGELTGTLSVQSAGIFGGAAAVFVGLGVVAYRRI